VHGVREELQANDDEITAIQKIIPQRRRDMHPAPLYVSRASIRGGSIQH
jgi:hypothetical protein